MGSKFRGLGSRGLGFKGFMPADNRAAIADKAKAPVGSDDGGLGC